MRGLWAGEFQHPGVTVHTRVFPRVLSPGLVLAPYVQRGLLAQMRSICPCSGTWLSIRQGTSTPDFLGLSSREEDAHPAPVTSPTLLLWLLSSLVCKLLGAGTFYPRCKQPLACWHPRPAWHFLPAARRQTLQRQGRTFPLQGAEG